MFLVITLAAAAVVAKTNERHCWYYSSCGARMDWVTPRLAEQVEHLGSTTADSLHLSLWWRLLWMTRAIPSLAACSKVLDTTFVAVVAAVVG